MPDFLLPDLGEGLTEAEILSWRVQVGDDVRVDQVVVEVETAKAAVEVPVPFAGTVSALHARAGQCVAVGAPLITVTAVAPLPAASDGRESGAAGAEIPMGPPGDEVSGSVLIGYGTGPVRARRRHPRPFPRRPDTRSDAGPDPASDTADPASDTADPTSAAPEAAVAVVSPLVRKIARDAALDLGGVVGTGPAGLVMRRDVESAIADAGDFARPKPDLGLVDRTVTSVDTVALRTEHGAPPGQPETRRIPLTGRRKAVADKLSRSRREIPEATIWVDVDASAMVYTRVELNRRDPARPVGVLALVARFAIAGLRSFPELNGRVEDDEILLSNAVHLGFAAQTERGLVVPVVRDAHRLSTRDLSAALDAHTSAARSGTLRPADLVGGTFTVNNYGVFGVDGAAAIINHPEIAILGIGRIVDKPWVWRGELAVRPVTQLTLAFDHRVCDGGAAGGFLRFVADCVENPAVALGDL